MVPTSNGVPVLSTPADSQIRQAGSGRPVNFSTLAQPNYTNIYTPLQRSVKQASHLGRSCPAALPDQLRAAARVSSPCWDSMVICTVWVFVRNSRTAASPGFPCHQKYTSPGSSGRSSGTNRSCGGGRLVCRSDVGPPAAFAAAPWSSSLRLGVCLAGSGRRMSPFSSPFSRKKGATTTPPRPPLFFEVPVRFWIFGCSMYQAPIGWQNTQKDIKKPVRYSPTAQAIMTL